jgi:starvation-inducible DNA-binding protein
VAEISKALTAILADMFALYVKTKNFHWHMSGAHFRDYHLLLDEQSAQILAATDPIAERVRKIGGTTLRSIGQIARLQRVSDNDNDSVGARTCWPSFSKTTSAFWTIFAAHISVTSTAILRPRA